jgi:GTP pyrophosphokinase
VFSCEHHADQRRKSGENFITHPVGVAKICAGMRLDTETLCAALLHDTVEDTTASLAEVRETFGDEVAGLVDRPVLEVGLGLGYRCTRLGLILLARGGHLSR